MASACEGDFPSNHIGYVSPPVSKFCSSSVNLAISSVFSALQVGLAPTHTNWEKGYDIENDIYSDGEERNDAFKSSVEVALNNCRCFTYDNTKYGISSESEGNGTEGDICDSTDDDSIYAKSERDVTEHKRAGCSRNRTTRVNYRPLIEQDLALDTSCESEIAVREMYAIGKRLSKSTCNLGLHMKTIHSNSESAQKFPAVFYIKNDALSSVDSLSLNETPDPLSCPKDTNKFVEELMCLSEDDSCCCAPITASKLGRWSQHDTRIKLSHQKKRYAHMNRFEHLSRLQGRYRARPCEQYVFRHYEDTRKYIEQYRCHHSLSSNTSLAGVEPKLGLDMPDPYEPRIRKYMYCDLYERVEILHKMAEQAALKRAAGYYAWSAPLRQLWEAATDKSFHKEKQPQVVAQSRQYALEVTNPKDRRQQTLENKRRSLVPEAVRSPNTGLDLKVLRGRNIMETLIMENRPLRAMRRTKPPTQHHQLSEPEPEKLFKNSDDVCYGNEFIASQPRTADVQLGIVRSPSNGRQLIKPDEITAVQSDQQEQNTTKLELKSKPESSEEFICPKLPVPVPPKRLPRNEESVIVALGKSQYARKNFSDSESSIRTNTPPDEPAIHIIHGMSGGKRIKKSKRDIQRFPHALYHTPDLSNDSDSISIIKHLTSKNPNITEMIFHDITDPSTYQKCLTQLRRLDAKEANSKKLRTAASGAVPMATVSLCEVYSSTCVPTVTVPYKHRQKGALSKIDVKGSR